MSNLWRHSFRFITVNSNDFTRSVLTFHHVKISHFLIKTYHFLLKGSNEILTILTLLFDNIGYFLSIVFTQSWINLIEYVKGSRLTFLQRHDHTNSQNCFLSSRKLFPSTKWLIFWECNLYIKTISKFD
jgi:hypothetical protein